MLRVEFQIITPLVLSGADQGGAELRLPSVKGMLRYWYRALDPEYNQKIKIGKSGKEEGPTWESHLFGGTGSGEGQSRFLMRLHSKKMVVRGWKKRTDLNYLAFSMEGNKKQKPRGYLKPEHIFSISFLMRPLKGKVDQHWRRMVAAIWLLGHVGGLGSRSRRGFGSVALNSWRVDKPFRNGNIAEEELRQIISQLPIAHGARSVYEWKERFEKGLRMLKGEMGWFPYFPEVTHMVLDGAVYMIDDTGYRTWEKALAHAGAQLKDFRRSKVDLRNRTVFGMPLLVPQRKIQYVPDEFGRIASPVWIRVVKAGDCYFPMFSIYRTPPLKAVQKTMGKRTVGKTLDGRPFSVPFEEVLDDFQNHLRKNGFALEVRV